MFLIKGVKMKVQATVLLVSIVFLTSCMSIAQKLDKGEYYTVLPQASYTIPENSVSITTTVCTAGTMPGFVQTHNTPGFNGVAGTHSVFVKEYPPPEGFAFYKMTIQVEKSKKEAQFDINKTYLVSKNGYKALPYYALPIIIGGLCEEKDLQKSTSTTTPFMVSFPEGKVQKYVDIWYAIPITDIPVSYMFFGSTCEVQKYEKK